MVQQDNQLLKDFSDMEKEAYLGAIASIATADRVATEDEIEFLRALSETAHLSPYQQADILQAAKDSSNRNLQRYLGELKNSSLKYSLITDIISFAKADGKYTDDEHQAVREIAEYLNISHEQFSALNQVVEKSSNSNIDFENNQESNFLNSSGIGDLLRKVNISPDVLMKGAIGILGPIMIGRMLRGRGNMSMHRGGGILENIFGGGMRRSGGLGSLIGMFGGGRGYGGMGSILGNVLSGGRRSGW